MDERLNRSIQHIYLEMPKSKSVSKSKTRSGMSASLPGTALPALEEHTSEESGADSDYQANVGGEALARDGSDSPATGEQSAAAQAGNVTVRSGSCTAVNADQPSL